MTSPAVGSAPAISLLPWHRIAENRPRPLAPYRRKGRTRPMPRPVDRSQRRAIRAQWSCLPLSADAVLEMHDE